MSRKLFCHYDTHMWYQAQKKEKELKYKTAPWGRKFKIFSNRCVYKQNGCVRETGESPLQNSEGTAPEQRTKFERGEKIHQGWPCLLLAANNIDKYRQHAIEMSETSSGGSTHGTTQITHREVCHLHTEGQRWQEVTVQRHSRSKSCSALQWHCIRWTPQKARPAGVRCPWEQLWFNSSNVGCNSRNVYVYMYVFPKALLPPPLWRQNGRKHMGLLFLAFTPFLFRQLSVASLSRKQSK